jgi:hypothetical protein
MARDQFNCRLADPVRRQISELAERHGMSQSEIVSLAIDRLSQSLRSDPAYRSVMPKARPASRD